MLNVRTQALSYAWGPDIEAEKREIKINGHIVKVRRNLYNALAQFRTMKLFQDGLKIWIDALTINQDNEEEKTSQILIMHQIYERAGNIVVWVGKEVEDELDDTNLPTELDNRAKRMREADIYHLHDTITVLEVIGDYYPVDRLEEMDECGDLVQAHQYRETASFHLRQSLVNWRECMQENPDYFSPAGYADIYNFFNRPYWRRLWVIQELIMGRSNMPIICGSCVTHWSHIRNAAIVIHHVSDIVNAMTKTAMFSDVEETVDTRSHTASHVAGIGQLELLKHRKRLPDIGNALLAFRSAPGIGGREALRGSTLDHALQLAIESDCLEPKDRIFGLLHVYGIPEYCKTAVKYTDSPGDIYKAFAIELLQSGRVEIFALLDGCLDDLELPSWVPNFIRPASRRLAPIHGPWIAGGMNKLSNFAPEILMMRPQHIKTDDGEDLLFLQGVTLVDRVDGVGAIQSILQKRIGMKGPEFFADVVQPSQPKTKLHLHPQYAEPNEKAVKRLIWRTLTCGTDINGHQASEEEFGRLLSCFPSERPPPNDPDIWIWDFIDSSADLEIHGKPLRDWLEPYKPKPNLDHATDADRKEWGRVTMAMAAMKAKTRGRRLFVTADRGLLGLGPNTLQPGNVVATIFGCGKPVVLFPIGGGRFHLNGECYVDELMGGDASHWSDIPDTDHGNICLV